MIALAAAAVIATAAPVTIPFAPILDRPLRYRTTQTQEGKAGPQRFVMERELTMTRSAAGYRATIVQTGHSAEAPPAVKAAFDAGMAPFSGVPVIVHLSASGEPGAVENAADSWAKVEASFDGVLAAMAARPDLPRPVLDRLRTYLASITDLPPDARDARLRENIEVLLGFGTLPTRIGVPEHHVEQTPSPLGGTMRVTGTIRLDRADIGQATYIIDTRNDPADLARAMSAMDRPAGPARPLPEFAETTELTLSRQTGLLIASRTVTTLKIGEQAQRIVKDVRLIP